MELISFKQGVGLFSSVCFRLEHEKRKAGKTTSNNKLRIKECVAVCEEEHILDEKATLTL